MCVTSVCVSKLETTRALISARSAETIIAHDDDYDEPAVLFQSGDSGPILTIELFEGDVFFETLNLSKACKFVERAKGRCDFQMTHAGIDFDAESAKWPEPPDEDDDAAGPFSFDDDDNAGWWKRGDA